jgi:hypothetical protein
MPSAVSLTSSSTMSAPARAAASKATRVFSGWSADAPRWATTKGDSGKGKTFTTAKIRGNRGLSHLGRGNYTRGRARLRRYLFNRGL